MQSNDGGGAALAIVLRWLTMSSMGTEAGSSCFRAQSMSCRACCAVNTQQALELMDYARKQELPVSVPMPDMVSHLKTTARAVPPPSLS